VNEGGAVETAVVTPDRRDATDRESGAAAKETKDLDSQVHLRSRL